MMEVACPRYWGPAAETCAEAAIGLTWTGATAARITMDDPTLEWTFRMSRGVLLAVANAANAALPLGSWRPRALVAAREWLAEHVLDLGRIDLSGRLPGGMFGTMMPGRAYRITDAAARLDGRDLGEPVRVSEPPRLGEFELPSTPLFAIGEAHVETPDPREYERLAREALRRAG
jgi:hypothetical protein